MKVLVNKMPKEPKECLFSTKIFKKDKNTKVGVSWYYGCGMNNQYCDFETCYRCNKLRELNG